VGNHEEAIRIGNKIDSLIKEGIPNFDKVFVLERQKRIKEIILNKEMIENFMESMRPSMDAGSMKNSSDVYFRYLLLSNITYWVN
jgi:D-ribose pyranose/furanose isomerase RbsD